MTDRGAVVRCSLMMKRWLVAVFIVHLTAVGVFVGFFVGVHRGDRGNAVNNHDDASGQVERIASTNNTIITTPKTATTQTFYFHQARPDRSGAVLEDMLSAHAHSFYNNLTYGGACVTTKAPLPHQAFHDQLIRLLGLQHILKFACPADISNGSLLLLSDPLSDPPIHRRFNTRIFRPEWLAMVRAEHARHRTLVPPPPPRPRSDRITPPMTTRVETIVVIHIRRGDVSLCNPDTADRYLPNQHYISLIESLLQTNRIGDNGARFSIEVYSEEHSEPEGWEGLLQQVSPVVDHRLSLYLNSSVSLTWSRMIDADVLVLSKSSFSFVPAIFATKEVVYTPFWLDPLPNWTIVDDTLMQTTRRANLRLRHELCTNTGDGS